MASWKRWIFVGSQKDRLVTSKMMSFLLQILGEKQKWSVKTARDLTFTQDGIPNFVVVPVPERCECFWAIPRSWRPDFRMFGVYYVVCLWTYSYQKQFWNFRLMHDSYIFFPNDNMFQVFLALQLQVFHEKMLPKPCQARANSPVGMLKMLVVCASSSWDWQQWHFPVKEKHGDQWSSPIFENSVRHDAFVFFKSLVLHSRNLG